MKEHSTIKQHTLGTWLCSISSVALLLTFVTMAAHVRLGLGHWPRPMTEDYHTMGFTVHEYVLTGVLLFTVFGAVPLWAILLLFRRFRLSRRVHIAQALVYCAGWLLIALASKYDPTTFTEWFLD